VNGKAEAYKRMQTLTLINLVDLLDECTVI
jgi:hypothetical protein